MKKTIRLILFIILLFIFSTSTKAEEYEIYKSGDLVRYNDIAFYVMYDSDSTEDSVQLLKMTPLTHDEINRYTDNKAIVSSIDRGIFNYMNSNYEFSAYGNMAYYFSEDCYNYYQGSGCKNGYDTSNVKKVVDAWTQENINENDVVIDEYGYRSRLLKFEDIVYFDSSFDINQNKNEYSLSNVPKWLSLLNYYGWTMTEKEICYYDRNGVITQCYSGVYCFKNNSYLSFYQLYDRGSVRPTIVLKKSAIKKSTYNEYHNNVKKEYKIGDIINYNDTSFYVIRNSNIDDSTVTLLKKIPLTSYELNKYGEGYINNYIYKYNITPGTVISDDNLYKIAYLSTSTCFVDNVNYPYSWEKSGCNQNYVTSNVKHIVDNWVSETISSEDMYEDDSGYVSRLLNTDDMNNLGYTSIQANTSGYENWKPSNDTPEFMFNDNTKGMLTMIPSYTYIDYRGGVDYGIAVANDGYSFIAKSIPSDAIGTVRPVVTLNKKEIAKKITNVEEIEDDIVNDDNNSGNNVIVDIETEVDNGNVGENITNDLKESLSVVVPNTLSSKNVLLTIVGVIVSFISALIFIYFKKK